MKHLFAFLSFFVCSIAFAANNPNIIIETNKGNIHLELYPEQAPKTVDNFLAYIKKDGYKETTFHRIIEGFMIQGGGYSISGAKVDTLPPISNESKNGLSNKRGTISMARTNAPHSASRQFFINHKNNSFLDGNSQKWGYTVFGQVRSGMDVVDDIANVATGHADKPLQPVIIQRITLVEDKKPTVKADKTAKESKK